ncbi:MAG: hypothetical protein JSU85_04475 [Candidatus Zixiibacteriota bacterium]|nr:MAG: hypothetical protein JSU85_04475 [candidate division Zixibacteria bacterium]
MRFKFKREPKIKLKYKPNENLLAAIYPKMYCPRCGSVEIGLKRLIKSDAVWECRECDVNFRLVFPSNSRF